MPRFNWAPYVAIIERPKRKRRKDKHASVIWKEVPNSEFQWELNLKNKPTGWYRLGTYKPGDCREERNFLRDQERRIIHHHRGGPCSIVL